MLRFASPLRIRPANVVEPRCASFLTPHRLPSPQPVSMQTTTMPAPSQPAQAHAQPVAQAQAPASGTTAWNNGMPFQHLPKWQPPEFDSSFLPVPDSPDPTPLQDPHRHFNWPTEQPTPAKQRWAPGSERSDSELAASASIERGQQRSGAPNAIIIEDDSLGLSPRFSQVRLVRSNGLLDHGPPSATMSQNVVPVAVEVKNVTPAVTPMVTPPTRPCTPCKLSCTPPTTEAECSPRGPMVEMAQCQSLMSSGKSSNTTVAPQLSGLTSFQTSLLFHDIQAPPRPLIGTGLSWVAPSAETPRSARPHEQTEATSSIRAGAQQLEWQCNPIPWQQAVPLAFAESSASSTDVCGDPWALPVVEATAAPTMESNEIDSEGSQPQIYPAAAEDHFGEQSALMAEVGDLRAQFADLLSERDALKEELGRTTQESENLHDLLCVAREELSALLDVSRSEMDNSFSEF